MSDGVYLLVMLGKEYGIPYWEIPIRTGFNENGDYRFGKWTLMGVKERENEEAEEMSRKAKLEADGKGSETYVSDVE